MKVFKLLVALAVPAMFAACTNEEILSENSHKVQEVIGAELVGSGISFKVTSDDAQSRIAREEGKLVWTKNDRLGLGWLLTTDSPAALQSVENDPKSSLVWANNLFQQEGEEQNVFTTKGNIYAGWQFAYFPFEYQEKPGTAKGIVVNPAQKTFDVNERYSQNFHVSGRQFITADKLDENFQLTVPFDVMNAMNTLYMTTKPVKGSAFVAGGKLANLKISSVTINAEAEVFTDSVALKAKELPLVSEGKDALRAAMSGLFKCINSDKAEGRNVSSTTNIEKELLVSNADGTKAIMPIAMPTYEAVDLDDASVSIVLQAGKGFFTIKYDDEAEEGSPAAKNNEVIEKLIAAYAENGEMTKWTGFVMLGEIQLYDDIFEADYTNILTDEDWYNAVELANALSEADPVFVLGDNAEVKFEDAITAPENGVKVTGNPEMPGKLIVNADLEWNNDVTLERTSKGVHLYVSANKRLTVNGATLQPYRLYNYGTIDADANTVIGTQGYDNFYYNHSVEVEYGTILHPASRGIEGLNEISYLVPAPSAELTAANIQTRIERLIAKEGQKNYVYVNKLIVNEGINLNLTFDAIPNGTNPGEVDPYNPSDDVTIPGAPNKLIKGLENVSLEINGGTITSTLTATLKNAVVNGGSLENVDLTGSLSVNNGTVTDCAQVAGNVDVEEGTIEVGTILGSVEIKKGNNTINAEKIISDVTVKAGENAINGADIAGNLTIDGGSIVLTDVNVAGQLVNKGTVTIETEANEFATIGDITNSGNLTANTDVYVKTITTIKGCTTTVNEDNDNVIWYTTPKANGGYVQAGTTTGKIEYYGTAQFLNDVENAKDGDVVVLKSDVELSEPIAVTKNVTIDLNGKTIKNTTDLWDESKGNWSLISVDNGANVTIKNGKVIAKDNDCFAIDVRDNSVVTIESGEFVGNISAVYCIDGGKAIIKGGKFSISQLSEYSDYRYTLNLNDNSGSSIEVYGGEFFNFDPANNLAEGANTNFVKEGTSTLNGNWYVVE